MRNAPYLLHIQFRVQVAALSFGTDRHAPENLLQRLSNNSW